MNKAQACSRLIEIAAKLALGRDLPSEYQEDYGQKTISTRKVAKMMEKARDSQREMSYQLSVVERILRVDNK